MTMTPPVLVEGDEEKTRTARAQKKLRNAAIDGDAAQTTVAPTTKVVRRLWNECVSRKPLEMEGGCSGCNARAVYRIHLRLAALDCVR